MLNLKSVTSDEHTLDVVYEAVHVNPGRAGTHLAQDIRLRQHRHFGRFDARIEAHAVIEPTLEAGTPEEALDKLADWAERLALAIRNRGTAANRVPVFECPTQAPCSSTFAAQQTTENDE